MNPALRNCLSRRPYVRLNSLTEPIRGTYLSLEMFDDQFFYIIELSNGVLIKLISCSDLSKKMDDAFEGDFVSIEFGGWENLSSKYKKQIAYVEIGREI